MKKKLIIIVSILIVLILGTGTFFYFNSQDKKSTLTVGEKQWIEDNKNKILDLSIQNDVPVLSDGGEGIIFDFLGNLENDTKLEFNKISTEADYSFKAVDKKRENDILVYRDNYALLTKNNVKYNTVHEISNLKIGVLKENKEKVEECLKGASNIIYKIYNDENSLISAINKEVDAIVLLKLTNLNDILGNDTLNISYNITNYTKDYVITLGDNTKLNKILTKYYTKWNDTDYYNSYNNHFNSSYFNYKKLDDITKTNFQSKKYSYGFVPNIPFDNMSSAGMSGINYKVINDFAEIANIDISYNKYNNIKNLVSKFNDNSLDLIFNYQDSKYTTDYYETNSIYDEKVVIITHLNNEKIINSVGSLNGEEVNTVKGSKIEKYLKDNGVKVKRYDTTKKLLSHLKTNSITALDYYTYDYYVRSDLKYYKVDTAFNLNDNYDYVIHDTKENNTLKNYFNFYLSFITEQSVINDSYTNILSNIKSNIIIKILSGILVILIIVLLVLIGRNIKTRIKNRAPKFSKTEKLRYIDSLTSLKNRNYLNDNISKWNSAEIYPQAVIIVHVNDLAYINDNSGHTKGDMIIAKGAEILIRTQLHNSEILRTSGNEYLIYLVGHEKKQVATYIRKISKEFKNIEHSEGATIGYSVIDDPTKNVDDAINEATNDMKEHKSKK